MAAVSASASLPSQIRGRIEAHGLVGASLVVAVSGGPDSLALIYALLALREDLSLTLHVAHLDHGLRAASGADAEFVRREMSRLGVSVTVDRADVAGFRARRRLSIEDAARRLRYRFLARTAEERQADAVTLGHTLDDQAETALMRILRGTGLDGLRAMSPLSRLEMDGASLRLFRPMLRVPRSVTVAYCSENGLAPRLDESNLSVDMTRNRIRLDLMPALETYNPSVRSALARLAESASLDIDFIHQQVERAARDVAVARGPGISLDRAGFARLHPALQRHLLRHVVREVSGSLTDLTQAHVTAMLGVIAGPSGRSAHLPRGLHVFTDHRRAYVQRADAEACPLPALGPTPFRIAVPGESTYGEWRVTARTLAPGQPPRTVVDDAGLRLTETFDADSIGARLVARKRAPGDRFQPLGMGGDTKLKDFMIGAHVPRRWRDRVPLLEADGGIAWVVGWRIAEWAKVTPATRLRVEVAFEPAGQESGFRYRE